LHAILTSVNFFITELYIFLLDTTLELEADALSEKQDGSVNLLKY